jgi:serine/threonine protein kinase
MGRAGLLPEAAARQGRVVRSQGRDFLIEGTPNQAVFKMGSEGLVHVATDLSNNALCRIKCFWEPTDDRRSRSEALVRLRLANLQKTVADALGGAPYELLDSLGPHTPFAVVMKDVKGSSWRDLKENEKQRSVELNQYPPPNWPDLAVRATWAFGLATAVLNMESRGFIHADLSDGNIVVNPSGHNAGDMALVDFDAFVHPAYPTADSICRGSEGYAAPEIWRGQPAKVGSDRVGMAILIQEFLVTGDPTISRDEGFGWRYDQEAEICSRRGEAHPNLVAKYPELATLLISTLRASTVAARPSPHLWRQILRGIAMGRSARSRLVNVTLCPHPVAKSYQPVVFSDGHGTLDLSKTVYGIRASLVRNGDGSIDAVVHAGATMRTKHPDSNIWKEHLSGARISIMPGTILFDPSGNGNVKVDAQAAK